MQIKLEQGILLIFVAFILVGCEGATTEPTPTPIPVIPTATAVPPTPTPIPPTATPLPPTSTPVPPTSTPTQVPPTSTPLPPTPTFTPAPPSYSEILGTYPEGSETCCTDVEVSAVSPDGEWTFTSGKICPGISELTVAEGGTLTFSEGLWLCYGGKITLTENITINDQLYEAGTRLTLDKDLKVIEVSNWD